MLSVSQGYRDAIARGARQETKAVLVLANGKRIELDGGELAMGGMRVSQSSSPSMRFDIGSAIVSTLELTLANYGRQWDPYRFGDATLTVYTGVTVGNSTEWLLKGSYIVEQPDSYGATIRLTCYDSMSLMERRYKRVGTAYPATLKKIVADICGKCGVQLLTKTFPHSSYTVSARSEALDGSTCLEVLAWAAEVAGCFADVDPRGRLRIRWYSASAFATEAGLDGGTFNTARGPYSDGDTADGGSFMHGGGNLDGGPFHGSSIASVTAVKSLTVSTDNKTITGLQVTASDSAKADDYGEQASYGSDGYVMKISGNPLVEYGRASEVAGMIGPSVVGMTFRPFSASVVADPTIEAGDAIRISDWLGRTYETYATQVSWDASGSSRLSLGAERTSWLDEAKRRTKQQKGAEKAKSEIERARRDIDELKIRVGELRAGGSNHAMPSVPSHSVPTYTAPDGNRYIIEVDSGGNPVAKMVPSEIRVTTPPTKTRYKYNEKIDYSGIVVSLYDANGNPFTDSRYPNGTVPFVELGFTKEYADETSDGTIDPEKIEWTADPAYIVNAAGSLIDVQGGRTYLKKYDGKAIVAHAIHIPTSNWSGPILMSPLEHAVEHTQGSGGVWSIKALGVKWYATSRWHWPRYYPNGGPFPTFDATGLNTPQLLGEKFLEAAGVRVISIPGAPNCPIYWLSPYTQTNLTTSFMIDVDRDQWVQKGDEGWKPAAPTGGSGGGGSFGGGGGGSFGGGGGGGAF